MLTTIELGTYAFCLLYISLQTKVMAKKLVDRGNLKRLVVSGDITKGVGTILTCTISSISCHHFQSLVIFNFEAPKYLYY
jgi:hypothetical protein